MRQCQRIDFLTHKLLCKSLNDFKDPPSPYHFRAIYIPEEQGERQHFVWVTTVVRPIDPEDDAGKKRDVNISWISLPQEYYPALRILTRFALI
jgi:hypothetical protein